VDLAIARDAIIEIYFFRKALVYLEPMTPTCVDEAEASVFLGEMETTWTKTEFLPIPGKEVLFQLWGSTPIKLSFRETIINRCPVTFC
jgi:hypothetical protein